jgi:DMATS type aromatic prenyltransferase
MGGTPDLVSERRARIARRTFCDFGAERLGALISALDVESESNALMRVFMRLLRRWGERQVNERPAFLSDIADDHAPFEFSVAFSEQTPEVQVYVEAQGAPPTLSSNMLAGRELCEAVATELGAPLGRLRLLGDIFFPAAPRAPFSIWIGASWAAGREIKLKVYLNPQVRGQTLAAELVRESCARLGFEKQWATLHDRLFSGAGHRCELGIVSLDLVQGEQARFKVYVRHHAANFADIGRVASVARDYDASASERFYRTLAESGGPYLSRPVQTEFAFVGPDQARPSAVTLEFPIGSYVANDEIARERISRCLSAFGLQPSAYERAVRAFATRALAERSGLHAHVTLRHIENKPRIAVYFASEAYVGAGRPV